MRRIVPLIAGITLTAGVVLLSGCSSRGGGVAWYTPAGGPRSANLALGPTREHAWLGERIAPRSDWPAVETGLRVESTTYYSTIIYDEESYYGRHGSVYHATESVETGIWLR